MKRLISILSFCTVYSYAAVVVQGNDTAAPFAFKTVIKSQTYDRKSGMFFVGLTAGTGGVDNGTYSISKANRPTFSSTPKFSAVIASASDPLTLSNATIEFLAFSPQTSKQILTGVKQNTNDFSATTVFALYTDGLGQVASDPLHDAGGVNDTAGIIGMTANDTNIFAAVKPSGSFWGDTNSGIALVGIGNDGTTITLTEKNAPVGTDGNVATRLDTSSAVLGTDFIFTNTQITLSWDEELQRLFIGVAVQSNDSSSNVVKSVTVGRLNSGALTLQTIAPNSAVASSTDDHIVIAEGALKGITTNHVDVLHASTGPDYLIVDCTATSTACNRIFALPLVNDTSNPTNAMNGTLAKFDSALNSTTKKFTVAASAPADLVQNNALTFPEGVVGAGDLPIQADDRISDLKIVGDAVYVSIDNNNSAMLSQADRGIFVSHAMFDDTGKIIRWTPWTKRVIPFNAFPGISLPGGATHSGEVTFFEVDGKTGNVWFVEGTTGQTVGITTWSTGQATNGLLQTLNSKMSNGVYSALDLDQATRGFLNATEHRYALFGGVNKVSFARVSESFDQAAAAFDQTYNSSPQTVITDFSQEENFFVTTLPDPGGCCNILEYSRTSTVVDPSPANSNLNFFFAGTENGLYVWSVSGDAFNASSLGNLTATPFSDGSWQKIETISGSIIDLKTSGAGQTLYIVTSESTETNPMMSTVYSVPFAGTVSAMFSGANIRTIAQTGTAPFTNALQFYGIQIIATGNLRTATANDKEQLILATNQGLYRSDASQAAAATGVSQATNQTTAMWTLIEDTMTDASLTTQKLMFNGVAGPNTPIRQTAWPFNLKDKSGFGIFDNGTINQLSGVGTSSGTDSTFNSFFLPSNFNANSTSTSFNVLDRIVHFFSDGGRRLFIFNRTQDPPTQFKIGVLPYNVSVWNITQPGILDNPVLDTFNRFFVANMIGDTGILLAGTERGAVGIE